MSHDEPRLQLHAYLKSLSGYRGAPLHVDLCFYVCNPKKHALYVPWPAAPAPERMIKLAFRLQVCNPKSVPKILKIHQRFAQEGYTHEADEASW